jgi:hypothetical protein
MAEKVKVITCPTCRWSTSAPYVREHGKCWHCGEKMTVKAEEGGEE